MRDIVATKSRQNDISAGYRKDCTDISLIYHFNVQQSMRCFADISAINRENKAQYSSIIISITFAQYCILADLWLMPLKLGRLTVLRKHTCSYKSSVPMATHSVPVPTHLISIFSDFKLEKHSTKPQTQANIFICLLDHSYEAPLMLILLEWFLAGLSSVIRDLIDDCNYLRSSKVITQDHLRQCPVQF